MTGKILVTTNGETVEHVAPCYELSEKGVIHEPRFGWFKIVE